MDYNRILTRVKNNNIKTSSDIQKVKKYKYK